jgi:hypothetical protein
VTDGVDVQFDAGQPQPIEERHHHFDDFGVYRWSVAAAQYFRANLVELAVAAFLWALAPEHRAQVIQLHWLG